MIAAPDSVADADPRIFNTAAADSADVPSQRWRNRRHTWRRKRDGGFDADLYEVVPLSEADAAYRRMMSGRARYRMVLQPG